MYWLPAAILGMVFADQNIIVKMKQIQLIKQSKWGNKLLKLFLYIIVGITLVAFRQSGIPVITGW